MSKGWTANYDMGQCERCGEEIVASVEGGKFYSVKHYCEDTIDTNSITIKATETNQSGEHNA